MTEEVLLSDRFSFFSFLLKNRFEFFLDAGLACLREHNRCPLSKFAVIACLAIFDALCIDHIGFIGMLLVPGFGFRFLTA